MNNTICYRSHYYKTATIQIILDSSTTKQNGMITLIIFPVTWQITVPKRDTESVLQISLTERFFLVHDHLRKHQPKNDRNFIDLNKNCFNFKGLQQP